MSRGLVLERVESLTCSPALFSPDKTHTQGRRPALTTRKSSKASRSNQRTACGCIMIVHNRIRILPAKNIDPFDSHSPQISSQFKLPLQSQIQAGISREA